MKPSHLFPKRRIRVLLWVSGLVAAAVAALLLVRPPGEIGSSRSAQAPGDPLPIGDLPGVTWADDIHPIFVRNRCGNCHTRGREARVEGLTEFSLGMIDSEDSTNPFYSYHELVYVEGSPASMEGETLRDGRCCWPRGATEEEKRRIWPGHPERSVLLRKLERDYYGWNRPPRFLEEGLRLRWGLPMPWGHPGENTTAEGHHESGDAAKAPTSDDHGRPERDHPEKYEYEEYPLRSWPGRVFFRAGLWLGLGRDELIRLPPGIPPGDRMLLRLWILDTFETRNDQTGLEVQVVDTRGQPVAGTPVELVGNYTSPVRRTVEDRLFLTANEDGRVRLTFPPYSVVTRTWHARVAGFADDAYRKIRLAPGERVTANLTAPPPTMETAAEAPPAGAAAVVNEERPHLERGEHR